MSSVLLNKIFHGVEDEEIRDERGNLFTLRAAAKQALLAQFEDERNLGMDEKVKRYDTYLKVKDAADPAELDVEDIALIKKLIGKMYGALIVGQAVRMLEGKD